MTNQEKIESVRQGEYAWFHDGTLEQLREVLKMTWPKDGFGLKASYKFYYRNKSYCASVAADSPSVCCEAYYNRTFWICAYFPDHETISKNGRIC